MGTILPERFEPIRLLRKDRASSTFIATDRGLGRNEVVVKMVARGNFAPDTAALVDVFSWYRGLRHVFISEILDAGLTPKKDLFYVRAYHPPSEFFTSANTASVKALVSAVDFLHSMRRIHGSIKPSNVFAVGGSVKIADPWVGQNRTDPKWPLTEEEIRFSAPEVLSGGVITVDSDLYSLGALLYRFYSGRDPFEDSDLESLKAKYTWASPRSLVSVSHVSKQIGEIVSNLLNKDPSLRIAAFETLKDELGVEPTSASRAPAVGLSGAVEKTLAHLVEKPRLRMALVEGPAGHGKSRFVEELQNRASLQGYTLILGETSAENSYATLARCAVALLDDTRIGTASLSRLRSFVESECSPRSKSEQEEIDRDLVGVLASIVRQERLILLIEDIDRGGRKLTNLIESLVRQLSDLELSIVVTARSCSASLKRLRTLRDFLGEDFYLVAVGSLNSEDSEILCQCLSSRSDFRSRAQLKAAGNAAFLEKYCSNSGRALVIPRGVRQTLSETILKLPKPIRSVAEVLSLFEHPVDWSVLTAVSGIVREQVEKSLSFLERSGVVQADSLSIRYPDARTLIYSRIPNAKRTELHGRCFQSLKDSGLKDESILANHAFRGGLFDIAASLYLQLARVAFAGKDYRNAGRYYDLVSGCRAGDGQVPPLEPMDRINLARCWSVQGDQRRAQQTLRHLLESERVREDTELLSFVYGALASPAIENAAEERVRLLELAIRCLSVDSPQMIHHYRALAIAFLSLGDSVQAEKALASAEFCCKSLPRPQQDLQLEDIRSSILMNQGNFKDAARCLLTKQFVWASPGSVSNNLAVCVEQLGDLRKSRELQRVALQEAELSGAMFTQVVSLGNLGAMEAKLGNIRSAETFFDAVSTKIREVRRQEGDGGLARFTAAYADMASFFLQRGDYGLAGAHLARINMKYAGPFPLELFLVAMTRCEVHLELGQLKKARSVLNDTKHLPINGDFFEVERLLVEARLQVPSLELINRLQEALTVCARLETLYQECRVRLALAKVFLCLNESRQASVTARTARRLSKRNGYKPLAARALLLAGLATVRESQKESLLNRSLEEASVLGLAPLVAECVLSLGSLRFARGDYAGAKHFLSKGVDIAGRLAEGLSAAERKSYLSRPDFRGATILLDEVSAKAPSLPSRRGPELLDKESAFFARLYRLTSAMTSAADCHSALSILLEVLRDSIQHPMAIVSGVAPKVTIHSISRTCSAEMGKRIAEIAALSTGKIYITGVGMTRRRDAAAWIPIRSFAMPSGIYIECPPGEPPLDEREIEFLTIFAAIAATAFDHVSTKTYAPTESYPIASCGIVGHSTQMREVHMSIEIAAKNAATVLVEGDSGTGKELVARAIHERSDRARAPFIPVDCGALPEGLIEAELFGAKKGAYTGATADRPGLFEAADSGTIFLDEISNLGVAAQAKLLRVLQEREVRKIGSLAGKAVDFRLIAATNCSLERLVRDGKFRSDLLYRLKVLHILLPPLRNRKDDIPLLATAFLERLNASNQTKKYFGPRVMERFLAYAFPGNVRELQNAVERGFYFASGSVITQVDFLSESSSIDSPVQSETEGWFKELTEGRQNFWSAVHDRYKRRDISRERVVALVDFGLRTTRGNYKTMASMLQIPKGEYHRFMDFLRRSDCLLDFRPYRRMDESVD